MVMLLQSIVFAKIDDTLKNNLIEITEDSIIFTVYFLFLIKGDSYFCNRMGETLSTSGFSRI